MMRQAIYGTLRLGLYFNFTDYVRRKNNGENLSFGQKSMCSIAAGGIGSFIGTPFDLCLVRFQSDSTLPPEDRRNYKNVFDAMRRIATDEGVLKLWNGAVPTMARAIALTTAQLVSYEESKERIEAIWGTENAKLNIFAASMVSAVATSSASLPFDNLKTKLQKQKAGPDGVLPYKNMLDCFTKSVAKEGVTGLWAGLPTYYFRVGPHAIITLITAEFVKKKLNL